MQGQGGVMALLRRFADKVLDRPANTFSKDQLLALEDLLARRLIEQTPSDLNELVGVLRQKHVVDSISVSQMNGSLLASTVENGVSEAISASALFNYIQSEIPKSEVVLIKSKTWNMLFRFQGKIFVIKAPASLSTIELKAISQEVESFLSSQPAANAQTISRGSTE